MSSRRLTVRHSVCILCVSCLVLGGSAFSETRIGGLIAIVVKEIEMRLAEAQLGLGFDHLDLQFFEYELEKVLVVG